jgi:hypothetical protein
MLVPDGVASPTVISIDTLLLPGFLDSVGASFVHELIANDATRATIAKSENLKFFIKLINWYFVLYLCYIHNYKPANITINFRLQLFICYISAYIALIFNVIPIVVSPQFMGRDGPISIKNCPMVLA